MAHEGHHHQQHSSATADSFRVSEPVFAEWGYYNVDYQRLTNLPLDALCSCCQQPPKRQQDAAPSSSSSLCALCENMSLTCQRELEKVSAFLHMKGSELEHSIRACEHYVQTMASLELDEQFVGLGQTEEAVGAAMSQVLAMARFRRSNFTAFWRQLDRLQTHCPWHYSELLDRVALSPLFTESSLETQQFFRASQLYSAVQSAYTAASGLQTEGPQHQQLLLSGFPGLRIWRGWIDHACVGKVHNLLSSRLSVESNFSKVKPSSTLISTAVVSGEVDAQLEQRTPPSPPQTHKSLSSSSLSSTASSPSTMRTKSKRVFTAFLDNERSLSKYHLGLNTDAFTRDLVSLTWLAGDGNQNAYISDDKFSGPWFAASHDASMAMLKTQQILPFLHGELNLNKLVPPVLPPPSPLLAHVPPPYLNQQSTAGLNSPDSGNTEYHRTMRREQLRSAQKIQKKIIMEDLKPLVLTTEDRIVYTDTSSPGSVRIVLRRNVNFYYKDKMAGSSLQGLNTAASSECWLASVIKYGTPPTSTDYEDTVGELPFDLIEIYLGEGSMPEWLSQLFFDCALVHPVLDFDVYIHSIAALRMRKVEILPYWMVDYSRGNLCNPSDHSFIDMSATLQPELQQTTPSCPCESTHLLHNPASSGYRSRDINYRGRSNCISSIRTSASVILMIAVIVSVVLSIWPYHQQIANLLVEFSDLVAQWIARLLHLH
ncbi:hypothetical protein GGI25_005312 [Coemansia spiralis]|uniref:VTC domain-containing protein n=2 Tax=Coemansia TaxID=4863 RepID=A0A9W8G4S0_9FUNG|nr:hypothetical protein EDC05_004103 [Coemansia umbellata]KAJ2671923.1 hypothetical protein GGI25_005312 [Coemansia spiralis]